MSNPRRFWLALPLVVLACGGHTTSARSTSTVEGRLDGSSFPSAVASIVATNEAGARIATVPAQDGSFRFDLPKAHTYSMKVLLGTADVPVVFPHAGGNLATSFKVSSGAAKVMFGTVHHLASAPPSGFSVQAASVACDQGGEHQAGVQDDQGDGECVDGKDAKTGAACVDEGDGEVDPTAPMAVPEMIADDVGGCEDGAADGEENDD